MIADIILTVTALIALTIATYADIKTTEIPDWLSYSLIFIALSTRLVHASLYNSWNYFTFGIIGLALMSVIGNIMYYSRQWGGGDAKLLMGLGASFGTTPSFMTSGIPFLLIIFISIIFFGAFYGIGWAIYLSVKNKNKIQREIKKLKKKESIQRIKKLCLTASVVFILAFVFINEASIRMLALVLLLLTLFYSFSWTYMKAIEKVSLHRKVPVSKLIPGDFILDTKICKRFKIPELGVEKKHIEKLKKSKIRSVEIKQGIPFVPSMWIGLVASFFLNNFFSNLF